MAEPDSPQYTKLPNGGPRVMPLPLVIPDAHRLAQPDSTPAPAPSFEKPAPRERLQPEPVAGEEPGFYILPRSMTPAELYRELFDDMPGTALRSFSQLNPDLDETLRAGTMIVLSDPNSQSCTYAESQLLAAAHEVRAALAPLTPEEANFMMRHAAEIAAFTGETSTWLGVSAAVMEEHLKRLRDTLIKLEDLHHDTFNKHGNLRSSEFFTKRRELLRELDRHLLGSTRVRRLTTLDEHHKLKRALGISSRSLVHHWRKAGAPGPIPGYSEHVKAISRAAGWMKTGGYIGIGIGAFSGFTAIKEVCSNGDDQACTRVKLVEGGKFAGATAGGYYGAKLGAELAAKQGARFCVGITTATAGTGGVVCMAAVIGVGALVGTLAGTEFGGQTGEFIYGKFFDEP